MTAPRVRVLGAQRIHPLTDHNHQIVPVGEPCGEAELTTINESGAIQVLRRGLETWRPYGALIVHEAGSLVFYLACIDESRGAESPRG